MTAAGYDLPSGPTKVGRYASCSTTTNCVALVPQLAKSEKLRLKTISKSPGLFDSVTGHFVTLEEASPASLGETAVAEGDEAELSRRDPGSALSEATGVLVPLASEAMGVIVAGAASPPVTATIRKEMI